MVLDTEGGILIDNLEVRQPVALMQYKNSLYAVCNDGSFWRFRRQAIKDAGSWEECSPIPGTLADPIEEGY